MPEQTLSVERWLAWALAEADRLGLPDLKPLLESLARSTEALRAADWNEVEKGAAHD